MTTTLATDLKARIKTLLDTLVGTTLGSVQSDDFRSGADRDMTAWPCAIIGPPAVESQFKTNAHNERTYIFSILVVQKTENINSVAEVEAIQEALMNLFDSDYTLDNKAEGGVEASFSAPEPSQHRGHGVITFTITLRARALYTVGT